MKPVSAVCKIFVPSLLLSLIAVSCVVVETQTPLVTGSAGAAGDITQLTHSPEDKNNPSVSPDGKTVAFEVYKKDLVEIWTLDCETGKNLMRVTASSANEARPAWLPDSKTLVFASDRLGTYAIWRRPASGGGGATMVTRGGDMVDLAPSCSPKENRIAFTSTGRSDKGSPDVMVNGVKQYTMLKKNLPYIWTVNVDGTALTQLAQGAYPVWSHDGATIAYSSNISGNWSIWTMSDSGTSATELASMPGKNQMSPSFSPDGDWIAYLSNASGNYNIWIMRVDSSTQTQVTSEKNDVASPCWGADGNIYFTSNKSGNWEIWRLTPMLP